MGLVIPDRDRLEELICANPTSAIPWVMEISNRLPDELPLREREPRLEYAPGVDLPDFVVFLPDL